MGKEDFDLEFVWLELRTQVMKLQANELLAPMHPRMIRHVTRGGSTYSVDMGFLSGFVTSRRARHATMDDRIQRHPKIPRRLRAHRAGNISGMRTLFVPSRNKGFSNRQIQNEKERVSILL
jgi:hypothetical protein